MTFSLAPSYFGILDVVFHPEKNTMSAATENKISIHPSKILQTL